MHKIDLSKFSIHTDLIIESDNVKNSTKKIVSKNIEIEESSYNKEKYITIKFDDITDKNNYQEVSDIFIKELKTILPNLRNKTILIVGLGNSSSTPDALGPKTIDNILVTRHLFSLGEVEKGYENVAAFKPQVTAQTGIETKDMIKSLINTIKADILIVIDSLAASSIERVNKTIQITTAGIHPGSGIGNNRKELSRDTLNIPVIAIGVPTIVDYSTIVIDTIGYLTKKISFTKENINNKKFSKEDKTKLLGILGELTYSEQKELIEEVLIPINYNLMVTPKEIDYIVDKLAVLIGQGLNKAIHKTTK